MRRASSSLLAIIVVTNTALNSHGFVLPNNLERTNFHGVASGDHLGGNHEYTFAMSTNQVTETQEEDLLITTAALTRKDENQQNFRDLWKPEPSDMETHKTLERYQTKAHKIASSFVATDYSPAPLTNNNHFQTIAGAFWRSLSRCTYWTPDSDIISVLASILLEQEVPNETASGLDYYDVRERVEIPDNDFFHVDHKYVDSSSLSENDNNESSRGTVILIHGFESESSSPLIIDMARSYISKGFDVSAVNFRGCSGEVNLQPGAYHLGFTDDLKLLLGKIKENNDSAGIQKPIYLSAFSLGANAVLKLLGELGVAAKEEYGVRGAAVTSVPFDLIKSGPMLNAPGINKSIYTKMFLKSVKAKTREKHEAEYMESLKTSTPFPFDYDGLMAATKISDLEDAYVSPIYGFQDHMDYYSKVMSGSFVGGIAVPVLAINAKDDPFFHPDMVAPIIDPPNRNPLRFLRTECGGHCGFMFHQYNTTTQHGVPSTSWMPSELARFIDHVDKDPSS